MGMDVVPRFQMCGGRYSWPHDGQSSDSSLKGCNRENPRFLVRNPISPFSKTPFLELAVVDLVGGRISRPSQTPTSWRVRVLDTDICYALTHSVEYGTQMFG